MVETPDMNWQKSLNTYAQRDHMRVWEWPGTESTSPIFVATATHDKSAGISFKRRQFVHHIDPNIDDERSKIIRDLRAAGCVRAVYLVPRSDIAPSDVNSIGDPITTDGSIAVVQTAGLPRRRAGARGRPRGGPLQARQRGIPVLASRCADGAKRHVAGQHHLRHVRCTADGLPRLEAPHDRPRWRLRRLKPSRLRLWLIPTHGTAVAAP